MFLGLAISIASIPGWTSITIPAGWAALSMFLPALALWRGKMPFEPLHLVLFLACVYALGASFGTDLPNALWRLWQLALFALAFHLGSTLPTLRRIWIGLAIGGSISSAIAIGQWLGIRPVMEFSLTAQSGLHYNPVMQGMILSVVAVALASEGLWLGILPLLPGIYLCQSRGAYFVLIAGALLTKARQPLLALCFGLATILYATLQLSPHDIERMQIWVATSANLSLLGHGTGSFTDVWLIVNTIALHPENVHNDFLQLLYEYGIGAVPFIALIAVTLSRSDARSWPVAAAIAIFSCFSFPLYTPITLFALALCAGAASRDRSLSWDSLSSHRHLFLQSFNAARRHWARPRRQALAP